MHNCSEQCLLSSSFPKWPPTKKIDHSWKVSHLKSYWENTFSERSRTESLKLLWIHRGAALVMKDPMMLLHMHKLWGNKKPRAILYNCFEWVVGQKQRDRLCGGLEIDMISYTTLFSGGACCAEGLLQSRRERSKLNSEEQTVLNIVTIIILGFTPGGERHGGSWLNGVVHQRNIREIEPRVGWRRCAAPHSSDGTICLLCFNLSTHYLLQFGGLTWGHSSLGRSHSKYSRTTVICGNPRVTGTHVKKRVRAYKVTASQWSFLKLQSPPQRGRCLMSTHCLCLLKIKGLHGYLYKYVISGPAFGPSTTINKAATDLNHNHQEPAWTGKHPQQ